MVVVEAYKRPPSQNFAESRHYCIMKGNSEFEP